MRWDLSVLLLALFAWLLSNIVGRMQSFDTVTGGEARLKLLLAGVSLTIPAMWLVYLLSSILTIFLTIGMISGEIEAGTFVVIVPKPLRRGEIVFGKWLGFALILGAYTALMSLAFMGVINWFTGYWPTQAFSAIAMLELSMLVLLGLTTLGGAFVPTAANGAIAIMLFIGALISSIVQSAQNVAPRALQNDVLQNTATIISLIMPTDAIWHGASFYLLPAALLAGLQENSIGDTPFTSTQPVAPVLLIWAVLYSIVLPLLAVLRFQRRDL